jgi:hypothetical protein
MRKGDYVYVMVTAALLLLAVIIFLLPGVGPVALDSEKVFMAELHNSLYYLDRAKWQWAEEKHKSERGVPTMRDLAPYLGDWTNRIERLVTLGIHYEITPISETETQSDIATLTRDLQFRQGAPVYRAGTRYCIRTRWAHSDSAKSSFRAFCINNRELLAAGLSMFGVGTLLVFVARKIQSSRQVSRVAHEHQNA